MKRAEQLKQIYNLQPHEEGGHFAEVYTAPFDKDGRALSGSIYFLLDGEETSRFHRIDCDEVWYFHEGCGMKITVLMDGSQKELLLGSDLERGDRAMVVVPKGSVFAAANLDPQGYTFVSCMTTPKFSYDGFQLVVSVAEMRQADARTIANGTPSIELMHRAAQGIFDAYDGWMGHRTLVICGSGNNGGDGYALAEILSTHGYPVEILRVSDKFSEDGRYYYEKCRALDVPVFTYKEAFDFSGYDILVDCMLGTGFSGVPREPVAGAILRVNEAKEKGAFVISADINSGMNGDTGEAEIAVKSDLTVSIGYLKHGLLQGKAKELIGRLVNVEIGIEL